MGDLSASQCLRGSWFGTRSRYGPACSEAGQRKHATAAQVASGFIYLMELLRDSSKALSLTCSRFTVRSFTLRDLKSPRPTESERIAARPTTNAPIASAPIAAAPRAKAPAAIAPVATLLNATLPTAECCVTRRSLMRGGWSNFLSNFGRSFKLIWFSQSSHTPLTRT